jgi:hypothetical protein
MHWPDESEFMMRTIALGLLLVATATISSLRAAESQPPNVVFIMVDDLG